MDENNTVILPQVEIVNSVSESANLLVENNGSIKRFPFSEIDVDIDLSNYATKDEVVMSINGKTGSISLNANDVGAVTEAQVSAMINNTLGVIENGSY